MAYVYATLIIRGYKTINDVPEPIKQQTKDILVQLGHPELAGS